MIRYERIKTVATAFMTFTILSFGALSRVSLTNASYRTGAEAGTTARVAAFHTEVGDPVLCSPDATLDCNDADDAVIYKIPVTNHSEVAVTIRAVVSGCGDNVACEVSYDKSVIPPLGGTGTAEIRFTIKDLLRKDQSILLSDVKAEILVEQAEGGETS